MKLRVEVMADDIAEGKRGKSCECAIANALKRAGYSQPYVQPWGTSQYTPFIYLDFAINPTCRVDLPNEAASLACRWDEGDVIEPFTFEIEVPDTAVSK